MQENYQKKLIQNSKKILQNQHIMFNLINRHSTIQSTPDILQKKITIRIISNRNLEANDDYFSYTISIIFNRVELSAKTKKIFRSLLFFLLNDTIFVFFKSLKKVNTAMTRAFLFPAHWLMLCL